MSLYLDRIPQFRTFYTKQHFTFSDLSVLFIYLFRCSDKQIAEKCAIGTYSPGQQKECSPCPPGFKCPTLGMSSPKACPLGLYQNETGQSTCSECPIGSYCSDTSMPPVLCPTGSYSLGNASKCLLCPAGYRYVDIFESC